VEGWFIERVMQTIWNTNLIHFINFVYFMMYLIKKVYTKLEHQNIHKI